MTSSLLYLLCVGLTTLTAVENAPPAPLYQLEHAETLFENFIREYNKQYLHEEEKLTRFEIFKENLERANNLNRESIHTVFGITQFMDLTQDEFERFYTGLAIESRFGFTDHGCIEVSESQISDVNAPAELDWREYNLVTPVRDQQSCNGCYAFSATGNIEGQYARKYQRLVELSKQQIIDCDEGSYGCAGGYLLSAFRSIIEMGGIVTESSYPYENENSDCQFNPNDVAVKLIGCYRYNIRSQEKLKQLVYSVGPISIAVQASGFNMYKNSVMTADKCNNGIVNHDVLLVGYGTENGLPYWLVKNSWGTTFGENGYIKIQRGEGLNGCGMFNPSMSSAIVQ